jgi:hypothetical protein
MAELAARRQLSPDFYLPATFDRQFYWRRVVVIDRLEEGWEDATLYRPEPEDGFMMAYNGKLPPRVAKTDPHGGHLNVRWELTELAKQWMEAWVDTLPDPAVTALPISRLGDSLADIRKQMGAFRCVVLGGGLERELQVEGRNFKARLETG